MYYVRPNNLSLYNSTYKITTKLKNKQLHIIKGQIQRCNKTKYIYIYIYIGKDVNR